jgi:hypothetical protein
MHPEEQWGAALAVIAKTVITAATMESFMLDQGLELDGNCFAFIPELPTA